MRARELAGSLAERPEAPLEGIMTEPMIPAIACAWSRSVIMVTWAAPVTS